MLKTDFLSIELEDALIAFRVTSEQELAVYKQNIEPFVELCLIFSWCFRLNFCWVKIVLYDCVY